VRHDQNRGNSVGRTLGAVFVAASGLGDHGRHQVNGDGREA
jgi:hypothetical protein